jgi:hypothetical protein
MAAVSKGPVLKPRVDCNLPPIVEGNLAQFREEYWSLANQNGMTTDEFGPHTRFALTGVYDPRPCSVPNLEPEEGPEVRHRLKVHPKDGNVQAFRLSQHCDVDSVIGFVHKGDEFALKEGHTFFYNMFNDTNFTLESSLHLPPYEFMEPDGNMTVSSREGLVKPGNWLSILNPTQSIKHHLIPNAVMGHLGGASVQKISVRLMFPRLATTRNYKQGSKVDKDYMQLLYNHAIRDAMKETLPWQNRDEWAILFAGEQFRARRDRGQVVFTPRSIPAEHLNAFLAKIHEKVEGCPELDFAEGFFLQIQIQGCKQSTQHVIPTRPDPVNNAPAAELADDDPAQLAFEEERENALEKAISPLDMSKFVYENWWVDIAATMHCQDANHSLLIASDMHYYLISEMTGMDIVEARNRVHRGEPARYFRDETAHLGVASGFRMEMNQGPDTRPPQEKLQVKYVQAYTTEKNPTALKDNGHFAKYVEPRDMFKDYKGMLQKHFIPLEGIFRSALDEDHAVNVRLECRVNWWYVFKVLRWFDPEVLARCLIKVKTGDFWWAGLEEVPKAKLTIWHEPSRWFKIIRLEAIIATLSKMEATLPMVPGHRFCAASTLGISLCWLTNALLNRPQATADFKILADTCSVHGKLREVLVAVQGLNFFTLHSIFADECPRLSTHRALEMRVIGRLCGIQGEGSGSEVQALVQRRTRSQRKEQEALPVWGQEGVEGGEQRSSNAGSKRGLGGLGVVGPVSRAKRIKAVISADAEPALADDEAGIPESTAVIDYRSGAEDPAGPSVGLSTRGILNGILNKMPSEIMSKVPGLTNPGGSWRLASDHDCSKLLYPVLRDAKALPRLLVCWRQISTANAWRKTVERLFHTAKAFAQMRTLPNGEAKGTFLQGAAQCSWFQDWTSLLLNENRRLTPKQVEETVEFMRNKIHNEVEWLPLGQADRLWGSKGAPARAVIHGENLHGKQGVVIVLNPRFCKNANIPGGREWVNS